MRSPSRDLATAPPSPPWPTSPPPKLDEQGSYRPGHLTDSRNRHEDDKNPSILESTPYFRRQWHLPHSSYSHFQKREKRERHQENVRQHLRQRSHFARPLHPPTKYPSSSGPNLSQRKKLIPSITAAIVQLISKNSFVCSIASFGFGERIP